MEHVLEFFGKGGFVMYPLLLCSIAGLAIVIEKFITLRRKKVIIPEIVSVIDNIKDAGDVGLALSICEKHNGPFANIITKNSAGFYVGSVVFIFQNGPLSSFTAAVWPKKQNVHTILLSSF